MKFCYNSQTFNYAQMKKDLRSAAYGDVFSFEKGVYHVYEEQTDKAYYAVSNCDAGVKSIAFYLKNQENVTIEGNGSTLMLHGRISPFIIDGGKKITIKGFTVDYEKAFYLQGRVVSSTESYLDLALLPQNEYYFDGTTLVQKIGDAEVRFDENAPSLWQAFDAEKKRVLRDSQCRVVRFSAPAPDQTEKELFFVEEIAPKTLRIYGKEMQEFPVGAEIVFYGEKRNANTVFANGVNGLTVTDLEIHHSPSFGVNCQLCKNVTLTRVSCRLGEARHGLVTANADATHFIACTGTVKLDNCYFENMLDDGTNVHSIFTDVVSVNGKEVRLRLFHHQQQEINVYLPGDTVIFYRKKSLQPVCRAKILSSRLVAKDCVEIVVKGKLSGVTVGDQAENYTRQPKFQMINCTVRNNRPRGALIATRKKAVVKNCYFSTSSSGVEVSVENLYWYESGGVTNLLIKNNVFEDCCHQYGGAAVGVVPSYPYEEGNKHYCRNIRMVNNVVKTQDKMLLFAKSSKNVLVKNNAHLTLSGQPLCGVETHYTENCKNVRLIPKK